MRKFSISARFQEFFHVLPGSFGGAGTAHHSDEFVDAGVADQWIDANLRPSVEDLFIDPVLMVREGRDLCKVRDTQDLITL